MNTETSTLAIDVTDLKKSYGKKAVLDGVGLQVQAGTVFALLGPNGAGKTTIVHILSTLLPADSGHVVIAGCDLRRNPGGVRAAIGLTGQFSAVDKYFTGRENLHLMGRLRHLSKRQNTQRTRELLEQFDLTEAANRPLSTYSGGMRRRLDLAMTLIGNPSIIFLDEPTTGLDPRSRHTMWHIIRELVAGGTTVFLTTQHLDEADELADKIAVLDNGNIVAQGTAAELKRRVPGGHITLLFHDDQTLHKADQALKNSVRSQTPLTLNVPNEEGLTSLRATLDRLDREAITIEDLSIHTPDLDDVFFAVTGTTTQKDTRA